MSLHVHLKFVDFQNLLDYFPSKLYRHVGAERLVPGISVHSRHLHSIDLKRYHETSGCNMMRFEVDYCWIVVEIIEEGDRARSYRCLTNRGIIQPVFDCVEVAEQVLELN